MGWKPLLLCTTLVASYSSLSCKARPSDSDSQVLFKIGNVPLESAPQLVMYHFGAYKFLREDTDLAVLAKSWPTITAPHVPWRKGLYVAQHPGYSERYALDQVIGTSRAFGPWLMGVHLKPECLAEDRYSDGTIPPTFFESKKALAPGVLSAEDYAARCKTIEDFGHLFTAKGSQNQCGATMDAYLEEPAPGAAPLGIAFDTLWRGLGFWYVRDPNCIEKISSTPEDVLGFAGNIRDYWTLDPFIDGPNRDVGGMPNARVGDAMFLILVRSLLETSVWDPKTLADIKANVSESKISWLKQAVSQTVDWAASCEGKPGAAGFRKNLGFFLDKAAAPNALNPQAGGITYAQHVDNFLKAISKDCSGSGNPAVASSEDFGDVVQQSFATAYPNEADFDLFVPPGANVWINDQVPMRAESLGRHSFSWTDKQISCAEQPGFTISVSAPVAGVVKTVSVESQIRCGWHTAIDFTSALAQKEESSPDLWSRVKTSTVRIDQPEHLDFGVILPEDAVLYLNGKLNRGTGSYRQARSKVVRGGVYKYTMKAKKFVGGKLRIVDINVEEVQAGTELTVNFTDAFR